MARVAFIVDEMFEDQEFRVPYEAVRKAGHQAVIVGLKRGKELKGKKQQEVIRADQGIEDVSPDDFDGLVVPGGYSPDHLRTSPQMVDFVREMVEAEKPVAVICHGGSMLAEADVLEGRTLTSWASIRTDLINAGAQWVDREVVEDGNLITSRKPEDLKAFCAKLLEHLESGAASGRVPPYALPLQSSQGLH